MLKVTTEEQREHIEEILESHGISVFWWPRDFENDALYIDDHITFDTMAAIIDYLAKK